MGCLKLTYNENNDTLKVAYSSCKENQKYCTGAYRYGFNGKENDNEVKGGGNSVDFGARIYDSRLGRWMSTDPLQLKYPSLSPFNYTGNNPIYNIDPDGKKIRPNGADAAEAVRSLFDSYSMNPDKIIAVFNIDREKVNSALSWDASANTVLKSRDSKDETTGISTIATPKDFRKRVKDAKLNLSKEEVKQAYSVYLALVDKNIIEVEVIKASKTASVKDGGAAGSVYTEAPPDFKLNNNSSLQSLHKDINDAGGATPQIVNDLFNNPGTKYNPDSRSADGVYYAPSSEESKNGGTIIINGTNKSKGQNAKAIESAIGKTHPANE